MALDPNQFEVIEDQPQTTDGRFELVEDDPKVSLAKAGFDMSKIGQDPYDKFKLQEYERVKAGLPLEDYSQSVPASLNPNYDFNRATGYGGPIIAGLGLAADVVGKGIVKITDIPTKIHNARIGASDPESPFHKDTLEEREAQGPLFRLPRVDTKDLTGVPAAVGGVENAVLGTAENMLGKPSSAFTLPLLAGEGSLARAAGGIYGLSTAAQLPEQIGHAMDVYHDPEATTAEKAEAISNPVVQGALAYGMLRHTAGPREAVSTEIQGPYSLGRMMKTPEGAEAPLSVERFEPLDTQSGSPLSPQELIDRQSRVPTPEETPAPEIKTYNLDEEAAPDNPALNAFKDINPESPQPAQPAESVEPAKEAPQVVEPVKKFIDDVSAGNRVSTEDAQQAGLQTKSISDLNALAKTDSDLKAKQQSLKEKIQSERDPEKRNQLFGEAMGLRGQIPREAIESATNTGGHIEGEGLIPTKLGDRPLDWKKNPEVAKWLLQNADKIGINLPEELLSQKQELVGMGGAVPSEFNPEGNAARDVYGIAHEVREARARAGQVEEVPRGEGINTPDSIARGRELLKSGADPESVLKNFEATKRFSSDDIAVLRAHGERLAQDARAAERKFGTDSPEHQAAYDKLSDFDARSKAIQTEWHKQGMAQQGQTDIDTGSFTGLQREYQKSTGKKFTPKQAKEAKGISDKVSKAADETETASKKLRDELKKNPLSTERQRVADAAANELLNAKKAVETAKVQEQAAKDAQAAADKTVREAAIRSADAETKSRVEDVKRQQQTEAIQDKAQRDAQRKVDKTTREAAARDAKAETQRRIDDAKRAKEIAKVQEVAARRARMAAEKRVRDAAAASAKAARAENVLKADVSAHVWKKAGEYIDKGITDFDDIRNGIATDLGMPVAKVTAALAKSKRAKSLTDELWRKQQMYRRLDQNAKRWIMEQQMPAIQKVLQALPNLSFAAKVFGHGTVALGTHAPMVAFQPPFWKAYANNFVKMYKMVGSPAFYEMQVQDLLRRPNYTTARRAGLVNDPYQFEDYNSPEVTKWMGPVASTGNRGYSVLKMLRQDMFDAQWNRLPKTQQIPEIAKAMADGINHATGVVRMAAPKGSNVALFAPRLEASRVAWLVADPLRAVKAGLDWKNASEGEKMFAINQVKEKAWVIGTMLTLLAANEGILEASGSNQRINIDDPMKRDWMKFKVGGMNIGYGNAMLSMARLSARLYRIRESDGGKLKNLVYPDEDTYSVLGEYGRSQLSPFASLATTLWFKSDWQNRPLPNSDRPVPKRLQARGVAPYTWPEFWTEQALPIPLEEGAREVWQNGLGMNDQQLKKARKAMATIAVMAATGARVEEDTETNHP